MDDNPLLLPSELPFQLPPFERIRVDHYRPALERGMDEQLSEVAAILGSRERPTVENTVIALDRSGRLLKRAAAAFTNQLTACADDDVRALEADLGPRLAAHRDAIHLDSALFDRVASVHDSRHMLDVDEETRRLIERYHRDFVRAGARLSDPDKERLRRINAELSGLAITFRQNVMADNDAAAVVVPDVGALDGLPAEAIAAAAEAARRRGLDGQHVLELILQTNQPVLSYLTDRTLRERVMRASMQRGTLGNEHDNSATVIRIAMLRAERAGLLGYSHHAAYVLADAMSGTPERLDALLDQIIPVAVAKVREEADQLQAAIDADGGGFALAPWDWAFYSARVRKARHNAGAEDLRPYLELNRVLHDGIFYAASRLYGLSFVERPDLRTFHPLARAFEVRDEDGSALGLFIADHLARPSKRGGAWMSSLVDQSGLLGTRPVVVNHMSIRQPADGGPALLTLEEVKIAFHEFGHALHGLFSAVRYPKFAGANVARDFIEYPSQVNEVWATWPEVVANYARHYQTGEPMPRALLDQVLVRQSAEAYETTAYLATSVLDQAWHRLAPGEDPGDLNKFEPEALRRGGLDLPLVPPSCRSTYFPHIFAGDYGAAYYCYLWSELLEADTVAWFKENGGLCRENGDWFRETVLSRGGSRNEMESFRAFRGREPRIEFLLERRGLRS